VVSVHGTEIDTLASIWITLILMARVQIIRIGARHKIEPPPLQKEQDS
jgi:hypothetical protein